METDELGLFSPNEAEQGDVFSLFQSREGGGPIAFEGVSEAPREGYGWGSYAFRANPDEEH